MAEDDKRIASIETEETQHHAQEVADHRFGNRDTEDSDRVPQATERKTRRFLVDELVL